MKIKTLVLLFLISMLFSCKGFQRFPHKYSHPSDSELRKTFIEKKDGFETLISMFLEDSKNKTEYFVIGKEGLRWKQMSEERKQEYLELFNSLDVLSISKDYDDPKIIRLLVSMDAKDLEDGELEVDVKGYYYSPAGINEEKITFGATDMWGSGCKEINENWFIFHETRAGRPE